MAKNQIGLIKQTTNQFYFFMNSYAFFFNFVLLLLQVPTHTMYYINDGVYGSFNCIIYDHAVCTPIPFNIDNNSVCCDESPFRACVFTPLNSMELRND